jgi:hypothetical protein
MAFATAFVIVIAAAAVTWIQVVERLRAPDPVAVRGTPTAIVWSERVFRSEAELAAWLRGRGINYRRWVRTHPAAVGILRSRERAATEARSSATGGKRTQKPVQRPADPVRAAAPADAGPRLGTPVLIAIGLGILALLLALALAAGNSARLPRPVRLRPRARVPLRGLARAAAASTGEWLRSARPMASAVRPARTLALAAASPSSAERVVDDLVRAAAPPRDRTQASVQRRKSRMSPSDAKTLKAQARQAESPKERLTVLETEAEVLKDKASRAVATDAIKAKRRVHPAPGEPPAPATVVETEAEVLKEKVSGAGPTGANKAKRGIYPAPGKKPPAPAEEAVLKEKLAAPAAPKRPASTRARRAARDPARRPLPAVAESTAPARSDAGPTNPPACEIRWWRGYVSSQFWAMARNEDAEVTIAVSPSFRWRKSDSPPELPAATSALRALVESLEQEGWTVAGHGDQWFSVRMQAPRSDRDARSDVHA